MDRRSFLKLIASIPVIGTGALFVSPLFRYLRPSLDHGGPLLSTTVDTGTPLKTKPVTEWQGNGGLFMQPDMPQKEKEIVFDISLFPAPWSFQTFTFLQKSREYTYKQFQGTKIPGYVVRLPKDKSGKPDFYVCSRICPHMGCVFNYLEDPKEAANYNYPKASNPLFACPCHLSVYDPLQSQDVNGAQLLGKVVSGPAPRPPRYFNWEIRGDKLVITAVETGGIS
jgi:Rieske Fe-S protein